MDDQTIHSQINGKWLIWSLLTLIGLSLAVPASAQIPTPIRTVTSLPATCNGGTAGVSTDVVFLLTSSTGAFYQCADNANHWTLLQNSAVNSQTVSYAAVAADAEKTIVMNGSALTLTLPNPPPSVSWSVSVDNINATGLTVSRNGLLIDGAASNLTLAQNQSTTIVTDGTNYFSQRGVGGAATTIPFNNVLSGANTTATMAVSSAATFTPTAGGQLSGNEFWPSAGLPAASLALNTSGGNLLSGHSVSVVYTLVTALGETVPSAEINIGTSGCTGGNQCQVVVTKPTAQCGALPCGPYTGYTVYSADQGAFTSGQELKQAASTACVNITTNCTINSGGAGSAFSLTPTAFVQPASLQASTAGIANGLTPSWYVYDWFNGNTVVQGGMLGSTNTNFSTSTFQEIRRHWFNDSQVAQTGTNALISINHKYGNFTSTSNQDRALQINAFNCTPIGSCSDSTTHYALEGIQGELDIMGTPTINGSPDGEVSMASFQTGLYATSSYASNSFGTNAVRAALFRQASAAVDGTSMNGVNAVFSNASTVSGGNVTAQAVRAQCANAVAISGLGCNAVSTVLPNTTNAFSNIVGLGQTAYANLVVASYTPRSGVDWFARNDQSTMQSQMAGIVWMNGLTFNAGGAFPVVGSMSITPSITTNQGSISPPASITCSGGASQYTYTLVGVDGNGGEVASSGALSPSTCVNPLTAGNPASVNIYTTTAANSTTIGTYNHIDVYRTGGPMATGKIGTITCNFVAPLSSCTAFSDTGLSATGTVPSVNTTGGITTPANGTSHLSGNFAYLDANFTTANNTNLQTINGSSHNLVFNLPGNAQVYGFHCAMVYSQATANVAVAFGIQSATVAPNNIFATSTEQITVGPPATVVTGTLATLASTSATTIVSGTPGALSTNYTVYVDGNIDEPQNNQGNVLNFMVSTATGTDAVTVLKGSYCALY